MTLRKKAALVLLAVIMGSAGILQLHRSAEENSPDPVEATKQRTPRPESPDRADIANSAKTPGPWLDRDKALKRLRARWLELAVGESRPEHEALAKETVETLSCSAELYGLFTFLDQNVMSSHAFMVEEALKDHFLSPDAAAARERLAGMTESGVNDPILQRWCFFAGKGCPASEFDAFRASLKSETCAQEALFAQNVARMSSEPEEAIRSTLDALKANLKSPSQKDALALLFRDGLPAETDFPALDQFLSLDARAAGLPTAGSLDHELSDDLTFLRYSAMEARIALFGSWAQTDPRSASDYVLADSNRMDLSLMSTIGRRFASSDLEGCQEWLTQLPEGWAFDFAAAGVIPTLRKHNPDEARELALKIRNPRLREESLRIPELPSSGWELR